MERKVEQIEFWRGKISEEWLPVLYPFLKENVYDIFSYLRSRKEKGIDIFPYHDNLFRAFNQCPLEKTKVLIIGQDPYYTVNNGKPVADGIAFSYIPSDDRDVFVPPSLKNILKEVENEFYDGFVFGHDMEYHYDTDLKKWANQGVLLLNTALTVEQDRPESNLKLWQPFTDYILNYLNENCNLVVMLWGGKAQAYESKLNNQYILKAAHPSPLSAHRGFFGCNHFKLCNQYLNEKKQTEIRW